MRRFSVLWPLLWSLGLVGFQAPSSPPAATPARAQPPPAPARAQPLATPRAPKVQPATAIEGAVKGPDGKAVEDALVIARKVGTTVLRE
jgi:hypothetical protein